MASVLNGMKNLGGAIYDRLPAPAVGFVNQLGAVKQRVTDKTITKTEIAGLVLSAAVGTYALVKGCNAVSSAFNGRVFGCIGASVKAVAAGLVANDLFRMHNRVNDAADQLTAGVLSSRRAAINYITQPSLIRAGTARAWEMAQPKAQPVLNAISARVSPIVNDLRARAADRAGRALDWALNTRIGNALFDRFMATSSTRPVAGGGAPAGDVIVV